MARLSCSVQCTRIFLLILNIVFIICGFVLFGFGLFVKINKKFDIPFSGHTDTKIIGGDVIGWVGISMIIAGIVTILLASFGCLGAVFKNRCFLYLYAIILGLLIIIELAALIVTLSSRVYIHDTYESGFRELFIETYSNNHTDLQYLIENIEEEFKCCGVENVTDYYKHNYIVPAACHQDKDIHKPIFSQGCADPVINWIWNQLPIIGGALGGVVLIEIFGVISSIALGIAASYSSYDAIN